MRLSLFIATLILLEDLNRQLEVSLATLEQERDDLVADLDTLTTQSLKKASQESRELIDHLFWRALQLLLIAVALFTLAPILVRRFFDRLRPSER